MLLFFYESNENAVPIQCKPSDKIKLEVAHLVISDLIMNFYERQISSKKQQQKLWVDTRQHLACS